MIFWNDVHPVIQVGDRLTPMGHAFNLDNWRTWARRHGVTWRWHLVAPLGKRHPEKPFSPVSLRRAPVIADRERQLGAVSDVDSLPELAPPLPSMPLTIHNPSVPSRQ